MNDFFTRNPATGELLKEYSYHCSSDIEKSLEILFKSNLPQRSFATKKGQLQRLIQSLQSQKQILATQMSIEMGKPISDAVQEIEKSIQAIEYVIQNFSTQLQTEKIEIATQQFYQIQKEALGVLFAIMPWNFPIWQLMRVLPFAFIAGNRVLLKHADLVAGTAEILSDLIKTTLGEDSFQALRLNHEQSAQVIQDSRVRAVTMTGSTRGGRQVAAVCGAALKKVVLELGGSDAYLVFADSDIAQAARLCAQTRLINNGQSCISGKRFLVEKSVEQKFTELFLKELSGYEVGDPLQSETKLGPLASLRFKQNLLEQIQNIESWGALKVFSKELPVSLNSKAYYGAQVFKFDGLDLKYRELELFGPVALLDTFESAEEAIFKANNSSYGLGAGVFAESSELFLKVSSRLEVGFVAWNDFVRSNPQVSFGGVKDSGFGRELGRLGFAEFLNFKTFGSSRQLPG